MHRPRVAIASAQIGPHAQNNAACHVAGPRSALLPAITVAAAAPGEPITVIPGMGASPSRPRANVSVKSPGEDDLGGLIFCLILRILPCTCMCMDEAVRIHFLARKKRSSGSSINTSASSMNSSRSFVNLDRPVRGHRFSKEEDDAEDAATLPWSPKQSPATIEAEFCPPPPLDAPIVCLLDPGSGDATAALREGGKVAVHLAIPAPEYDLPVKRYPPHWRSMRGVKLSEAEVEAEAKAEAEAALEAAGPTASWPSVSDLRGAPHPRNLATWASAVYSPPGNSLRAATAPAATPAAAVTSGGALCAVDLAATGADRLSARSLLPSLRPVESYACIVCGSRGGEVTLPALWLLGCRVPAVVINGGCAREKARWLWPTGVPVVMLTGGQDRINNEFCHRPDGDAAYIERLWHAVPHESKATTAILHLPLMAHRPDTATLRQVLPALVAYAAAGLARAHRPTAAAVGGVLPCTLVTKEAPTGEILVPVP